MGNARTGGRGTRVDRLEVVLVLSRDQMLDECDLRTLLFHSVSISSAPHDTNLEVSFTWGIGNLAYAPIELLGSSQAVGVMMFGIGFAAAAIVYFVKLSKWMASDYSGALADPAGAD